MLSVLTCSVRAMRKETVLSTWFGDFDGVVAAIMPQTSLRNCFSSTFFFLLIFVILSSLILVFGLCCCDNTSPVILKNSRSSCARSIVLTSCWVRGLALSTSSPKCHESVSGSAVLASQKVLLLLRC